MEMLVSFTFRSLNPSVHIGLGAGWAAGAGLDAVELALLATASYYTD
jgi:hypothetical protein